jgi:hypothetical protein
VRHQLPVSSPIVVAALMRAARSALLGGGDQRATLAQELCDRFGSRVAHLTDSGTSALVLALRATVGKGGTVAFPSYSCIDLAAAALYAGVRVRLYDLDQETLSVDVDSLEDTLRRGVGAVVAVHLYGYATDVPGMTRLAANYGVPVIEDAAQAAGGSLNGRALGSFGPLTVLSFGRGKGITGGNGGALLATTDAWASRIASLAGPLSAPRRGWSDLAGAAAQWAIGRPSLYGIPASIPALHLGEMVYHPAHEPTGLSLAAATLVRSALRLEPAERERRRANATALMAVKAPPNVAPVRSIEGSAPGYLRLAVRASDGRAPAPALGALRGYPRALYEQQELRPCLHADERAQPNGAQLRASLFTLPVHGLVSQRDRERLAEWLADGASSQRRAIRDSRRAPAPR